MKFKSVKLNIFSLICDSFVRIENQEKKLTFIQFDNFKRISTIPLNSTERNGKY